MKKIEDYLHLYLGCEAKVDVENELGQLLAIVLSERIQLGIGFGFNNRAIRLHYSEEVKLILRPLSDMTDEESKKVNFPVFNKNGTPLLNMWFPEDFLYLLSKHFDLFGLIDAGLAIDKTKTVI